jgi:hypothetical protein
MAVEQQAKLSPADLSPQLGVYYRGRAPGGEAIAMWSYSHETTDTEHGHRWWFEDCLTPADSDAPLKVPFTTEEVGELLQRVRPRST